QTGSLDDRDPAFVEEQARWMAPISDYYFRGEVRHLDRIPAEGGVLCVGNHSGGLLTPDSWVLLVNWIRTVGPERAAYGLAHSMILGLPGLGTWLRKFGTIPAHPEYARQALQRGAAVLVYPGGDEDVFRSWRDRNRIHLAGRTGFIRLALQERVPIIPIVSVGGHETTLVLGNGEQIAKALGLERLRIKSLPLVIGPPWGISPGDLLGHWPLPAKITVECCEPIDFFAEFGELDPRDPEVIRAGYMLVEQRMQQTLDRLAAERKLPVVG
ncbi:MAG: acyltransferase family protein, partial [Cyanobacteria bacterium REEB65]|nr:acyltransferase family protein [Cyanobacteria bacterium REEB65]